MRQAVFVIGVLACKAAHEPPSPPAPTPAPPRGAASAAIVATTSAPELLAGDGGPLRGMPIAAYRRAFAGSTEVVVAAAFPDPLSSTARAGVNLQAHGQVVSWVLDGDPGHGYWLRYDENANGDLRDDPRRTFRDISGRVELALATDGGPVRLRIRDGELYAQAGSVRRGELALPGGPMRFALLGDRGQYGLDYQLVAFDRDRDGLLDLATLDGPEQVRVFEQAVTLDDHGYAFSIDPGGAALTLTPVSGALPPRASLRVGTVAPDVALTSFDGARLRLSDLRGRLVLVDFWATMCHPCVQALPHLAALRAQFHDRGFELVAIAMPSDDVREVLGAHAAGIEAADDPAQTAFRVDRFPTYFLLDRDRTILCSRCSLEAIEPMIAAQLGGPSPRQGGGVE